MTREVIAKAAAHNEYVFSFSCPDRLGVVAKQSEIFYQNGAYITKIDVHTDPVTERFFSRCVFDDRELKISMDAFRRCIAELSRDLEMDC